MECRNYSVIDVSILLRPYLVLFELGNGSLKDLFGELHEKEKHSLEPMINPTTLYQLSVELKNEEKKKPFFEQNLVVKCVELPMECNVLRGGVVVVWNFEVSCFVVVSCGVEVLG